MVTSSALGRPAATRGAWLRQFSHVAGGEHTASGFDARVFGGGHVHLVARAREVADVVTAALPRQARENR